MDPFTIGDLTRLEYHKSDYTQTPGPYRALFSFFGTDESNLAYMESAAAMQEHAKMEGVNKKDFVKFLKAHRLDWIRKEASKQKEQQQVEIVERPDMHFTSFGDGEPGSICCGMWQTDGRRVFMVDKDGRVLVACPHPILPLRRLVNVDTGIEKTELWFKNGKRWKSAVVENSTIASAMKIVSLADLGVAVTSESAKLLVAYLAACQVNGQDQIEIVQSVSHLGHIKGYGFFPYCDGLAFDGDKTYRLIYETIKPHGDYDVWKAHISEVRRIRRNEAGEVIDKARLGARLVIDASFAAAILHELGDLSFFVHLWGVESGTGKTVALMCAASVWADPSEGKYIQSWNSTSVGLERYAAFFCNLPMIIDETQIAKGNGKSRIDLSTKIYELSQGTGRTRGNKTGVDATASWKTCFITSGETPITQDSDGAGALNRAIEIETETGNPIIEDGHKTVGIVQANYGWAGQEWAKLIESDDQEFHEGLKVAYDCAFQFLQEKGITGKQAMASAALYAADLAVSGYIFHDMEPGNFLDPSDMLDYLKTKESVDINLRAYGFLRNWIAANVSRFQGRNGEAPVGSETYGRLCPRSTLINMQYYNSALQENGYHPRSLTAWMKARGLLVLNAKGKPSTTKSINGKPANCIEILDEDEE